jgi:hypothetical protein
MAFADLVEQMDRAAQDRLGAVPVLYQPAIGGAVAISGIFDALYVLAKGSAQGGVEALGPAVFFRLEDLPVNPDTDTPTLTIGGIEYRVTERHRDSMGGILLELRKRV